MGLDCRVGSEVNNIAKIGWRHVGSWGSIGMAWWQRGKRVTWDCCRTSKGRCHLTKCRLYLLCCELQGEQWRVLPLLVVLSSGRGGNGGHGWQS